jgi:hypothetical protein
MFPSMRRLPKGICGQGVVGRLMCKPKKVGGIGPTGELGESTGVALAVTKTNSIDVRASTRSERVVIITLRCSYLNRARDEDRQQKRPGEPALSEVEGSSMKIVQAASALGKVREWGESQRDD